MKMLDQSKQTKRRLLYSGCSAFVLMAAAALPAVAQSDPAAATQSDQAENEEDVALLGTVTVTANRREEVIDDVPLAISAFTGEFTKNVNLNDVKDLITFTPGITGNSKDSFIDVVAVRGIRTQDFGVGGDPSVGFFKNGLYQGRNGAVVTSLFDVERSEVLRGPQNFLFGRGAIAGAINVHTKRPDFDGGVSGYVDLDAGSRGHFVGEAALNVPISKNLAARFAGYYSREDGYVDNAFNPDASQLGGFEKWALRGSIDYISGPFSAQVTLEYEDRDQAGSLYRVTGLDESFATLEELFGPIALPEDGRDINSDLSNGERDTGEIASIGIRLDYDLGWATLVSQTGYKYHEFDYAEDFDGTPLNINNFELNQVGRYFEQEFRIVSSGSGPLSWYAGGSYYNEDLDALFTAQGDEEIFCAYYYNYYYGVNLFGSCLQDVYGATAVPEGLLEQGDVDAAYDGWAVYADVTYEFTETFDVSVGLRYSDEDRTFANNILEVTSALGPFFTYSVTTDGPLVDSRNDDAFTPRFIARYRPNEANTFFASATRGFKSGGFGTFGFSPTETGPPIEFGDVLQQGDAVPDDFDAETLWSYEVGHKGVFYGGRLRTDINGYFYDYEDLQLLVFQDGGGLIFNLGEVQGYGIEGSINAVLSDNFDLLFNLAWNESDISDAGDACGIDDCDGNRLDTPRWSGASVLNAHMPFQGGELFGAAEIFFESTKGGGIENLEASEVDPFFDASLRAGYRKDNWSISAYIENISDELYFDQGNNNGGITPAHVFGPSRPRTFGARLSVSFGN